MTVGLRAGGGEPIGERHRDMVAGHRHGGFRVRSSSSSAPRWPILPRRPALLRASLSAAIRREPPAAPLAKLHWMHRVLAYGFSAAVVALVVRLNRRTDPGGPAGSPRGDGGTRPDALASDRGGGGHGTTTSCRWLAAGRPSVRRHRGLGRRSWYAGRSSRLAPASARERRNRCPRAKSQACLRRSAPIS